MRQFTKRFVKGAILGPLYVGLYVGFLVACIAPWALAARDEDWRWLLLVPVELALLSGLLNAMWPRRERW